MPVLCTPIFKKILISAVAVAFLGACSQEGALTDPVTAGATGESKGDTQSSVTANEDPGSTVANSGSIVSPTTDSNSVVPPTIDSNSVPAPTEEDGPQVVAELTEEGIKYEQNIGINLRATSCDLIANMETWMQTDIELVVGKVSDALTLIKNARDSAATYIPDATALKQFQDSLDSSLRAGDELRIAFVSRDVTGASKMVQLLDGIQEADKVAKVSLKIPLTPPCP